MKTLIVTIAALATWAAPPIEHDYAEVNGVRLHYAKSGSRQLMLFLHGFPEFSYAWHTQLQEFGERDFLGR